MWKTLLMDLRSDPAFYICQALWWMFIALNTMTIYWSLT